MRMTITPEEGEEFEPIELQGVTDYFFAVRGKNDLGFPYAPTHGFKGEYAFLLGWLEYLKEMIKKSLHAANV